VYAVSLHHYRYKDASPKGSLEHGLKNGLKQPTRLKKLSKAFGDETHLKEVDFC